MFNKKPSPDSPSTSTSPLDIRPDIRPSLGRSSNSNNTSVPSVATATPGHSNGEESAKIVEIEDDA
jgi:hypothetical protein